MHSLLIYWGVGVCLKCHGTGVELIIRGKCMSKKYKMREHELKQLVLNYINYIVWIKLNVNTRIS